MVEHSNKIDVKKQIEEISNEIDMLDKELSKAKLDLKEAAEHGDLRENSQYDASYSLVQHLEQKRMRLEKNLKSLLKLDKLLKEYKPTGYISLGSKVTLQIQNEKPKQYLIVPAGLGDSLQGFLDIESLQAKTACGKKAGDEYKINTGVRNIKTTIISVE